MISVLEQLEEHSLTGKMDISNAIYILNNQPTTYDIDNVVEKLKCDRCESCSLLEVCAGSKYCGKCHEKIIEIVKQGGVSDDFCEWKKSKDYPFDWLVGCDGCEVNHRQGDYCPRCGKKIKIVGD